MITCRILVCKILTYVILETYKLSDKKLIEEGESFIPKFNEDGLIPAIAQDYESGQILMVAYMNNEALELTIETSQATYYSRSRKELWRKGQESGHGQQVKQILVDCDQDCLILKVQLNAGQCHVGYNSCFYRELNIKGKNTLKFIAEKVYDPKATYKK